MPREFIAPPNMNQPRAYSHAIKAGNTIYVAGQVGIDSSGNLVGEGDCAAQADQVWKNIGTVLAAVGAKLSDLVKVTTFITNADDIPKAREARQRHLPEGPPPTATLVVISALANPSLLVEIEAIAVVD